MLLVHSPLLTPAMWDSLRPHLEAAGWRVAALDLRPLVEAPSFHAAVCAAAAASVAPGAPTVVVGHSRAGAYLPGIADAVGGDRLDVVFLDARLPHPGTIWVGSVPPERATWLRSMAGSGRLPTWDTWFPAGSLDGLLPDPGQRRQVLRGSPELPWKVVAEVLPEPGGAWNSARHIYLQLSAAYQPVAEQAAECGYLVRSRDADHLAMVTRPTMITELLLSALEA
ncbi:hypothetical protein ONA91_25050 [Micromonospora sp. DR5-3]|uniref:alpha/beta fold hydrolase n=1 Tax=unclassified Micromonospora TaxID=2617518 RepID=UPI0011DC131A|nr:MULTISPECIES: alpha/beta fold hydrolase [unclassified Micromonospora]MCW3817725.1 hypothetical protein [Micromonospora sp. DR5-3]TYC20034.1 alpha/beta hydrolase [Micromonospora sp. MP36]